MKVEDDKVVFTLDGKERLIGTYYYKDINEVSSFKYGDFVYIKGTLMIPNSNTVPYSFNYKEYLNNHGINYVLKIDKINVISSGNILYRLKNKINDRILKIDNTGYMKAFILGDKSLIDSDDYNEFQSIGIAHLFAISGMHIGLLSEILIKILKKLKTGLKYAIIDVLLVIYGFIVCFPSSILRCITFYIINSINKVFNLDLDNKKVLVITIFVLILINHSVIYDIGFLFSISTVGGILLCSSYIKDSNRVKSLFKLSLIAFLFSLPISLMNYYEFNILSVFYNMLFVPFISFIVYPLSLITFIFPFLNKIFSLVISLLEFGTDFFSSINVFRIYLSFNIWEALLFYIFLYFTFVKQHKLFICCVIALIIIDFLMPYFDSNSYLYFLDVKQGDATLYVSKNRKEVTLIDTGGVTDRNYLVSDSYISMMKYLGINRIDNLIITHGDYDHMGEAINLVNNFKVEKVIFNCGEYNDLENELIKVLDKKKIPYYSCIKELNIDKNKLYFLQTKKYDNENDNSNVIYTELNGYKFMFMGDVSSTTEKEILDKYNLPDIDVLKVGHHGSKTSSSKEFINEINPKYSIISVGKNNRFGHPNKEVLDNLKYSNIYRTDEDGSIMFKIKNNRLKIETCSP